MGTVGEKQVNEWISVNDRLPEDENEYLVFTNSEILGFAYFDVLEGWLISWVEGFEKDDITHWMPLPEPPRADA